MLRIHRHMRFILFLLVACAPHVAFAQSYTISPPGYQLVTDNAGRTVSGGCVWTYTAGTTTAATTYSDNAGTTNTNPIKADTGGRFVAYLATGSSYKYVYENTPCTVSPPVHGSTLKTVDNITAMPTSAASVDVTGTAGESITAGQCVYLSDGSGSKTPGQWYKCDSANTYSSTTNWVGLATVNIASASSGTIRIAGSVTGLTSLSVGSIYYAGTAGALTSTAPTNARKLGEADSATTLVLTGNPPPASFSGATFTSPTFATSILGPFFTGCGIRLTGTTAVPVTVADVTNITTIFATPYSTGGFGAGVCAFYDGSATWTTLTFTETSIPLGTLTGSLPYDVFCYNNSGTMACEVLAWTNTTTRATALVLQNGVLVKTGATTRRYIGTFYTTSTTQTQDTAAQRYLWNYYNRVRRTLEKFEATASWSYSTATVRQANGSTANQVEVVVGVQEATLDLNLNAAANNNGAVVAISVGIGEDSTTTYAAGWFSAAPVTTAIGVLGGRFTKLPAVGRHVYSWNEWSAATPTTTWFSANASVGSTVHSGLEGWIEG